MKGHFSVPAFGLAINSVAASKCKPSKPAPSSTRPSSSLPLPSSSSTTSSSSTIPSSSIIPSSSSSPPSTPSISCDNLTVDGDFSYAFDGWTVSTTGEGATFGTYTCMPDLFSCAYLFVSGTGNVIQMYQVVGMVPDVSYTFTFQLSVCDPGVRRGVAVGQARLRVSAGRRGGRETRLKLAEKAGRHSPAIWPSVLRFLARARAVVRRATFNSYRKSFSVPTGQQQLVCSFQANGPAQVSLAAMVLQPTECSAWMP